MEPSTINPLLSDHIIKALCATLMHSLWQGVVLAALTGAIIIFTKKASAAFRYNLLVAALALFAVGVAVTFMAQMQKPAENSSYHFTYVNAKGVYGYHLPAINTTGKTPVSANVSNAYGRQASFFDIIQTITRYLNMHCNAIVLIWFLIICAKSVQMAVGLHGVYHLKRTKISAIGKYWEDRILQLAEPLRIRQSIRLLESGLAKAPMVIGHLKPVILIPIGLVNALSAEEVEAILLHELAHIRRRDYLVNFLQSFMEIIFFFNPAVLWLSQLIRAERENCCDDIAIAQTSSRFNYMNALLNCHEFQWQTPAYGMAFAGKKGNLLSRIKRVVNNRNQSLNMFEKTVLTISLVALGLGVSAFTARKDIKKAVKSIVASIHHETTGQKVKSAKNDTTTKGQIVPLSGINALQPQAQKPGIDTSENTGSAALVALVQEVGQAPLVGNVPVVKDGFDIPDTTLKTRNKATAKLFHDIGIELYHERLLTDTMHMNISLNERELIVNGVRMPEYIHSRIYSQFGRKGERSNYSGGYADKYNYLPSDGPEGSSVVIPDFGDTLVKYGVIKDKRFIHATFTIHGLIINGVKQPDDICQMLLKKYGDNVNITYTNNGLPDKRMEQQAYWTGRQRKLIDEMQREGLINDRKDLSFSLTDKKFVINGVEQSDEVFQRYRQEYVPADATNWHWSYNGQLETYGYPASANGYRNSDAYYRQNAEERQRLEAERDKKLVADLLQDGLITNPNNVTFTLSNKKLTINGKDQSNEVYQKYKGKYVPNDAGGDWSWTYQHHK